jgi:hypothetical protein
MAVKEPNLTQAIGTDALQKYLDAQKQANEVLEERNNRLFDPTMLAMAQGFLAPTKTGGFGESLGNVAAAVGPAQAAEEKRTMDMAKMRLEMAQQGLQTSMQTKKAEQNADLMRRIANGEPLSPAPAAQAPQAQPAPAPAPAPQAGALPSAAPQAPQPMPQGAPAMPQAAPPMPQAPLAQAAPAPSAQQAPAGTQLFPAMPQNLSREEKLLVASMANANKEPFEILKELDEMRRKNIIVNERGATDVRSGRTYAPPDPTPTEVRLPDGTTNITTKTMASRLAGAQAAGDAEEYFKIVDQIKNGMKRPAPKTEGAAPNATPTGAPPAGATDQSGMPTKEQEEASAAGKKERAVGEAKSEVKRRETLPQDIRRADALVRSAESLYKLVDENPKGFGTFDKPGILPAIGTLVSQGLRANSTVVDITGLEEATRKINPKIKDSDISAVRLAAAEQANIELAYAQMFLAGTGPITEGERVIVRRAGAGNVSNSPEVLKLRARAVGKRAEFERNDLDAYRQYVEKNPDGSYLKYMSTPAYKKVYDVYDKEMNKLAGITSTKQQKNKPDLKAAGANVDKETD